MRPRMVEKKIHSSHLGIENSIRNASDILFWPSIRADIKAAGTNAESSITRFGLTIYFTGHSQTQKSLIPRNSISLQRFDLLPNLQSSCVIEATKRVFARPGSPTICFTDNSPQFICEAYTQFAKPWNFQPVTSSPYFSQSNGRAEAAVKSTKNLLKKRF